MSTCTKWPKIWPWDRCFWRYSRGALMGRSLKRPWGKRFAVGDCAGKLERYTRKDATMENQTMIQEMATDAQFIQGQMQGALRAHQGRMAGIRERRNEARIREMDFDAGVADALRIADKALRR